MLATVSARLLGLQPTLSQIIDWTNVSRHTMGNVKHSDVLLLSCCHYNIIQTVCIHHNTHLMAFCPGLPGWAGTRKAKPIWIYWSKRVTVASAGSYANLHLTQTDNLAYIPPLSYLQARCPYCHPTNSVKALKITIKINLLIPYMAAQKLDYTSTHCLYCKLFKQKQ